MNSSTLATSCKELTHWKRPWCWEGLGVEGEGDRGWDGWMASLTQWTLVWVNSGSCWWTGRPGVLRLMGSQSRTRLSNWAELNWMWWDNKIMPNYILDTEKQVMEHKNATQYKHCAITNTHSHTHTHGKLMLTMNCPLQYVKLFFF